MTRPKTGIQKTGRPGKLTTEDHRTIREWYFKGRIKQGKIAAAFKVSQATIARIVAAVR